MSRDLALSLFIQNNLRSAWLDKVMIFITSLGNYGAVWVVLCAVLLIIKQTRRTGIFCTTALVSDAVMVDLIKMIVKRARPFMAFPTDLLINKPSGYSFPSAHASVGFAVAVTFFLMSQKKPERDIRWGILLLAFLIAFSRIYLFVHYTTDVLCGALLGIFIAVLVKWLGEKLTVTK